MAAALTADEYRLLRLLPAGSTFRMIAAELDEPHQRVLTSAVALYRKLGVSCRDDAIERARQLGFLNDS